MTTVAFYRDADAVFQRVRHLVFGCEYDNSTGRSHSGRSTKQLCPFTLNGHSLQHGDTSRVCWRPLALAAYRQ
jgi:hypothetical protein